jgi:hypothetical protein
LVAERDLNRVVPQVAHLALRYIHAMVRIAISQSAFDAIASTMALGSVGFENVRAPNNEVYVWLDHATVAKLHHLRGPGESFSDAIILLAEDIAAER